MQCAREERAFMAVAALLVAETSVGVVCATGRVDLGFLATVRSLCGPRVGSVAGAAYAFIHYALLVAYADSTPGSPQVTAHD